MWFSCMLFSLNRSPRCNWLLFLFGFKCCDEDLTRFTLNCSKDVYAVDELIPRTLSSFMQTLVQSVGSFVVIIYSTFWFATVVVPLVILYFFVQVYTLCFVHSVHLGTVVFLGAGSIELRCCGERSLIGNVERLYKVQE